jgi:hypothetical protein
MVWTACTRTNEGGAARRRWRAPPGAVVIGASLSPDGRYGAALTLLPSANYLMDDVFVRDGDRWLLNGNYAAR